MNVQLTKVTDILAEHDGHMVQVGGPYSTATRTVDVHSASPETLTLNYAGFSVYCFECQQSLSNQWGA